MGSLLTPLRKRPYPAETDTPDVAADLAALATNLDSAPIVGAGTLASRPVAAAAGNRYYVQGDASSANNGIEWIDTGSGWVPAAPAPTSGTLAAIPTAGTFGRVYYATDSKQWFRDNGSAWVSQGLTFVPASSSLTATNGQIVGASPGVTITLPSPVASALVVVFAGSTVTGSSPVTVSGSSIYGDGLSAATSLKLGLPGASVWLEGDGSAWYIVGGQQDTGWVALTAGTGWSSAASGRLVGDQIRLKGQATTTTTTPNATMLTGLPAVSAGRVVIADHAAAGPVHSFVSLNPITTTLSWFSGPTWANGDIVNLDGVSYPA